MGDLRVDDEGEKSLTQERLASRRRAQEGEAFILAIGAKCWLKLKRNQQSRTITRRGRHTGAGTAHGRDGTAYMRGEGPAPTHACGDRYSATPARYPSSAKPPPRHKPHSRCPSNRVNPNRSQSSWRLLQPSRGFTRDARRRRRRLDARPDFRPDARPDDWLAGSSPWSPRAQAR